MFLVVNNFITRDLLNRGNIASKTVILVLKIILNELNLKGKKLGIEYDAYGLTGKNAIKLNNSLRKNIGIIVNFSPQSWLGGINYYINFNNLLDKKKFKLTVFCGSNEKYFCLQNFKESNIVVTEHFKYPKKYLGALTKIKILFFGKDNSLIYYLKENKIDILFGYYLGRHSEILSIPIIWDFQELINPKNFSLKEIILRKFTSCK